ncbi:MAG: tryptophan synthase subunit alpha [Bacteroidota bacterium]
MDNRITALFAQKQSDILSVFFTAGYPGLDDTLPILKALEQNGVDLVEIGVPFSDPIADGGTIQQSSNAALENGMSLEKLFEQLNGFRAQVNIPVILMGYLNPIVQYGVERFCEKAAAIGVDGVILPDLPIELYEEQYKALFEKYQLSNILLITPQTAPHRIEMIDQNTEGFIYMVSSNSITGKTSGISEGQVAYFNRINSMGLRNPRLIGFGISDQNSFETACQYASGAIIGSAFIRALEAGSDPVSATAEFVKGIKA